MFFVNFKGTNILKNTGRNNYFHKTKTIWESTLLNSSALFFLY